MLILSQRSQRDKDAPAECRFHRLLVQKTVVSTAFHHGSLSSNIRNQKKKIHAMAGNN